MGVSYNGGRHSLGYSVRNKTLRQCNSCGFTTEARYNTHHKYVAGLLALLTSEGIQWYAGRYPVTKSCVREIWSLSRAQLASFERWVYRNDPFMVMLEEE
jgi:membrane protein DedA with SNARE-associated domain